MNALQYPNVKLLFISSVFYKDFVGDSRFQYEFFKRKLNYYYYYFTIERKLLSWLIQLYAHNLSLSSYYLANTQIGYLSWRKKKNLISPAVLATPPPPSSVASGDLFLHHFPILCLTFCREWWVRNYTKL